MYLVYFYRIKKDREGSKKWDLDVMLVFLAIISLLFITTGKCSCTTKGAIGSACDQVNFNDLLTTDVKTF